jgi:hypothetical protein
MPRQARIDAPGALQHVIIKTMLTFDTGFDNHPGITQLSTI